METRPAYLKIIKNVAKSLGLPIIPMELCPPGSNPYRWLDDVTLQVMLASEGKFYGIVAAG